VSAFQKWFLKHIKRFDLNRMTACTLVFEGSRREVAEQERSVYRIAARFGGMKAGAENGVRGYQLTFGIAYIRDWIMNHYLLGESFETSVPWSQALSLCENVKRRIREEHAKRGLPGAPFVTCRVTQLYLTGVCVYFYFAYYFKNVENPSQVFAEIEHAARDEVLESGGSLSHHHGIGKLRRDFLPRIQSPGMLAWSRGIKQAVDPTNVFGAGNQNFTDA
jgi:alkyldihydroxyacetonephosphate synthase